MGPISDTEVRGGVTLKLILNNDKDLAEDLGEGPPGREKPGSLELVAVVAKF